MDNEQKDPRNEAEGLKAFTLLLATFMLGAVFTGAFWLLAIAE